MLSAMALKCSYMLKYFYYCYLVGLVHGSDVQYCTGHGDLNSTESNFNAFKKIIPNLEGSRKGDSGQICVIGGSTEYTGAPYFAAITSLKVGADLVYVITTEPAAPVIKAYSPDLIVYPFLNQQSNDKIRKILLKMDVIVIGPGLGTEKESLRLISDIIETCKDLRKPLIIDADGLYAISKNILLIRNYPSPGVILTPNHRETQRLKNAIESKSNTSDWYSYWGENVSILSKGQPDIFYSGDVGMKWSTSVGGSGRRAGGQGDVLAGALGTFFNWALKATDTACEKSQSSHRQAASISSFIAATFTRSCNSKAFDLFGRSMTTSDMLNQIHLTLQNLF